MTDQDVFEHYFINYQVKGSDQLQITKHSFPIWRALYLVDSGNKYFERAEHWIGEEDVDLLHVHPEYGGEDELPSVYREDALL